MNKINRLDKILRLMCTMLTLLFLALAPQTHAAELTATEKALLERIEALEKRIEQLEGEPVEPVEDPALARRVEKPCKSTYSIVTRLPLLSWK